MPGTIAATYRSVQAHGVGTLDALFSLDPAADPREVLDRFVPRALVEASAWSSPRTSDGVVSCRVVEQGPTPVRVCGRIWDIDQRLHSFWLDVERELASPVRATWTLYFGIDLTLLSPRRVRNALEAIQDPGDVEWSITLTGTE